VESRIRLLWRLVIMFIGAVVVLAGWIGRQFDIETGYGDSGTPVAWMAVGGLVIVVGLAAGWRPAAESSDEERDGSDAAP
jgi:hypothetical protein